ncbi:MAG: hypothetical protein ABIR80_14915 [Opitutaceae bacterium]
MRKPLSIAALLFAWLCANGALLDVVQALAWGKMFAGYARTMSVAAALDATFDPAKRCELCVGVAQARDSADKQLPAPSARDAAKLVLVCDTPAKIVFVSAPTAWPAAFASAGPIRTDPVPLPPPRV